MTVRSDWKEIHSKLMIECSKHNIAYDLHLKPIKIGPDCYQFYGTQLTEDCRRHGKCKVETYYALTGGDILVILDSDKTPLP